MDSFRLRIGINKEAGSDGVNEVHQFKLTHFGELSEQELAMESQPISAKHSRKLADCLVLSVQRGLHRATTAIFADESMLSVQLGVTSVVVDFVDSMHLIQGNAHSALMAYQVLEAESTALLQKDSALHRKYAMEAVDSILKDRSTGTAERRFLQCRAVGLRMGDIAQAHGVVIDLLLLRDETGARTLQALSGMDEVEQVGLFSHDAANLAAAKEPADPDLFRDLRPDMEDLAKTYDLSIEMAITAAASRPHRREVHFWEGERTEDRARLFRMGLLRWVQLVTDATLLKKGSL